VPLWHESPGRHEKHVCAERPHCATLVKFMLTHAPPSGGQQPSHAPQVPVPASKHVPPLQTLLEPHAGPVPHWQPPLQVSPFVPQLVQLEPRPFEGHWSTLKVVWQEPLCEQQPFGQLCRQVVQPPAVQIDPPEHIARPLQVHAPLVQVFAALVFVQSTHMPPAIPQKLSVAGE
jgi:hypothetical protein